MDSQVKIVTNKTSILIIFFSDSELVDRVGA